MPSRFVRLDQAADFGTAGLRLAGGIRVQGFAYNRRERSSCEMETPQPRRPQYLPDYSEMCLQALVDRGLAEHISLGGAFGLLHYLGSRLQNS